MSSEGTKVSESEKFKVMREKWEITVDAMLIIGKNFEKSRDYINVM